MKRLFFLLAAVLMTVSLIANEKFSFVIEGSEESYNQIRVVNRTSIDHIRCRVVVLGTNNDISHIYGVYNIYGYDKSDSNTESIQRGTKIGLQLPEDFDRELIYEVEYRDYPFFDAVVITLYDKKSEFSEEF